MHQLQKEGPSIFASTTDKSRYLSLKRCKQGRKPGIWAMSVPISNWRFCMGRFSNFQFFTATEVNSMRKRPFPFAAPLSSSVFCWSHLVIMFFSCKSTRFYTKKRCTRTQYMEFLQDSVTSKLSARHVCGEIDAIKLYISCIPFLISKRIKIHSQFAPRFVSTPWFLYHPMGPTRSTYLPPKLVSWNLPVEIRWKVALAEEAQQRSSFLELLSLWGAKRTSALSTCFSCWDFCWSSGVFLRFLCMTMTFI